MYVDGFNESIKTLVDIYREQERNTMCLDVVHYERAEGDTVRARNKTHPMG